MRVARYWLYWYTIIDAYDANNYLIWMYNQGSNAAWQTIYSIDEFTRIEVDLSTVPDSIYLKLIELLLGE